MPRALTLLAVPLFAASGFAAEADVVVYGATPGGIAAAVSAARMGRSVTLIEPHNHIGGMTASGLGKSDVENRAVIGGLFIEFTRRVTQHYKTTYGQDSDNVRLCRDGYYYEPSVAEAIFNEMLREQPTITVLTGWRLESAIVPVAASTTHVAYSSIRMEPTWMCLGQAAGVAAHLAIEHQVVPRNAPIAELQALLSQ